MSNVQIPKRLFLELVKLHLGEIPADEEYIKKGLMDKLNKMADRERYTRSLESKKTPL